MIQRIQSVYLLLVAVTAVVMLLLPLVSFTNVQDSIYIEVYGAKMIDSEGNILTMPDLANFTGYLLVGTILLSFISIFLYKNRRIQKVMVKFILLLATGVLFSLVQSFSDLEESLGAEAEFKIGFYLPVALIVLCALAIRSIKKDDELVKIDGRLR